MRRLLVVGLLAAGAMVLAPSALAQVGNTDAAHSGCAQGGGNGPVFGARGANGDVGGMAALTNPGADHGAAGVLANNSNEAGPGEGGREGGLGGSSLRGGGAGGCGPSLPTTGSPVSRVALVGLAFALFGVPLLLVSRLRPWETAVVRARFSPQSGERMMRRLRYLEIRERYRA